MVDTKLPAAVIELMPMLRKNIPWLVKGGFAAKLLIPLIKKDSLYISVMGDPVSRAAAIQQIKDEFGCLTCAIVLDLFGVENGM